jgi:leucyl-tRNA synthetase
MEWQESAVSGQRRFIERAYRFVMRNIERRPGRPVNARRCGPARHPKAASDGSEDHQRFR